MAAGRVDQLRIIGIQLCDDLSLALGSANDKKVAIVDHRVEYGSSLRSVQKDEIIGMILVPQEFCRSPADRHLIDPAVVPTEEDRLPIVAPGDAGDVPPDSWPRRQWTDRRR